MHGVQIMDEALHCLIGVTNGLIVGIVHDPVSIDFVQLATNIMGLFEILFISAADTVCHSIVEVYNTLPSVLIVLIRLDSNCSQCSIRPNALGLSQMAMAGVKASFKQLTQFYLCAGGCPCIEIKVMYMYPTLTVQLSDLRLDQIIKVVFLSGVGSILQHCPHRGIAVDVGIVPLQVAVFCLKNGDVIENIFYFFSKVLIHVRVLSFLVT